MRPAQLIGNNHKMREMCRRQLEECIEKLKLEDPAHPVLSYPLEDESEDESEDEEEVEEETACTFWTTRIVSFLYYWFLYFCTLRTGKL